MSLIVNWWIEKLFVYSPLQIIPPHRLITLDKTHVFRSWNNGSPCISFASLSLILSVSNNFIICIVIFLRCYLAPLILCFMSELGFSRPLGPTFNKATIVQLVKLAFNMCMGCIDDFECYSGKYVLTFTKSYYHIHNHYYYFSVMNRIDNEI